jgi:hypothetical protein
VKRSLRVRSFFLIVAIASIVWCGAGLAPAPANADYTITLCGTAFFANGVSGYEPFPGIGEQCTSNPKAMILDGNWVPTTEGYLGELTLGHAYAVGVSTPAHITISGVNAVLTSEAYRSGATAELQVGGSAGSNPDQL